MSWSMHRVIRGTTKPAAAALVAAFALLFPLTCVTGPEMTPAQKACRAAMGHDCGPMAQQGCCAIEVGQIDQFALTKKVTLNARAHCVTSTAIVEQIVDISPAVRLRILDASHRSRSAPTYLLDSALLI